VENKAKIGWFVGDCYEEVLRMDVVFIL